MALVGEDDFGFTGSVIIRNIQTNKIQKNKQRKKYGNSLFIQVSALCQSNCSRTISTH